MEQRETTGEAEHPMETEEVNNEAKTESQAEHADIVETANETEDKPAEQPDIIQQISEKIVEKPDNTQEKSENILASDIMQENSDKIQENSEKNQDNSDNSQTKPENIQKNSDNIQEQSDYNQEKIDEDVDEGHAEVEDDDIMSAVSPVKESAQPEMAVTASVSGGDAVVETVTSKPESPPQPPAEVSDESVENKNTDRTPGSSSEVSKEDNKKVSSLPVPSGDSYEDSLTELKLIFENKNAKNTDSPDESPSKTNKSAYEDQFEQFILHTNTSEKPKSGSFKAISEETSNSSWYKIGSSNEQPMEISVPVVHDDISNMSVPDNASVVSSNIGDSCMSFQDQASNMDECSNLSVPEDTGPVEQYTGHAPVFDESANMNPPENVTFIRPDTPSSIITDTNMSESTPAKKTRRGTLQIAVDDASEHGHNTTAADIYEYQWPKENDADFYILQEQISIFLDIKSFKRKYPDLFRRVCDKHEKDYLREKGVVSETQCDLGLTALKSDEVQDLMSRDYPAKYKEYLKVIHERERQRMADKMKEHDALKLEKDRLVEYTKRAMKSASDWNRNMLKERNEERRAYFDTQTFTIQYPKSKFRKLENVVTGVTAYPLSLIPGQFQDYYRKYNSEELKYFPLNMTLFDPPKKVDNITRQRQQQQMEEETESQEDEHTGTGSVSGSDSDDDSSSSSEESDSKENVDTPSNGKGVKRKEKSSSREASKEKSADPVGSMTSLQPVVKLEVMECRICKDEKGKAKQRLEEEMIRCSECKSTGHPSCLDLTDEMVKIIKTYPWQCMECKTCVECMDPYDEDKMMFCDKCDRGYHTFCVGLKSLPTGHWECKSCRGDSTPLKPIPRPTPKSKRGRKTSVKEDSQSKDKPLKDTPARERPERFRQKIEMPNRDRTVTREIKPGPRVKQQLPRPPSRDSVRMSRESSRSSMKDD